MKFYQACRYKLKTDEKLDKKLTEYAGYTRFVWNKALSLIKDRLYNSDINKIVKNNISFSDQYRTPYYLPDYNILSKMLTFWKSTNEYSFLRKAPAQTLQQTLKDLEKALKSAFTKGNGIRFPKFKKKGKTVNSIKYPQGFEIDGSRIYLPKIGWVRFFKSREIDGIPKSVTVKQYIDGWYISIIVEKEIQLQVPDYSNPIGIDLGVKKILTLSTGLYFAPVDITELELKLKKHQRILDRKQHPRYKGDKTKPSNNFLKQKAKIAKINAQIADKRLDYLHKITTVIAKSHGVIAVEDLQVKSMTKSAKGTLENPGTNVRVKSKLNKSILNQSWSKIIDMLEYKTFKYNKTLVKVSPDGTSQTCPVCYHRHENNRLSQSEFKCQKCGYENNADLTASAIILDKALKELGMETPYKTLPQGLREVTPVEYSSFIRDWNEADRQVYRQQQEPARNREELAHLSDELC
ncbi:MAG: transposase [Candidatus Parvarchaeum sp.]